MIHSYHTKQLLLYTYLRTKYLRTTLQYTYTYTYIYRTKVLSYESTKVPSKVATYLSWDTEKLPR